MNLRRHFGSGSIAVSGASAREGKLGYGATKNVVGFDGPIFPVHPNREDALFGRELVDAVGDRPAQHAATAEVDVNRMLATWDGALALDALVLLSSDPGGSEGADAGDGEGA